MTRTIIVGPQENIPVSREETISDMKRLPDGSFEVTISPRDFEAEKAQQERRSAAMATAARIVAERERGTA